MFALLAAGGLIVGCFGPKWLVSVRGPRMAIGLRNFQVCAGGQCEAISNFQMVDELDKQIAKLKETYADAPLGVQRQAIPENPWHGFPVVGWITLAMGLISAIGLVWGAVLALQRKRPDLPIMPTTLAVIGLALGIVNGCLVLATKPDIIDDIAVGWSFWAFGAGAVLGLTAVFPLNRQIRPIDEELGEASATMSWGASRDDE
ncbi:MAG TPA: hypothetical protein VMZ53_02280 [Kofleriaceae bacterium]|nr:hypothetical protein [Kofleriaceae bacterium]